MMGKYDFNIENIKKIKLKVIKNFYNIFKKSK